MMEMVFKRGEMIVYDIAVIKSVDGILPTPLDFMQLGSVIMALLPCHITTTIRICQVILLVLQLVLEPLME